jgi:hypothetical protein
MEEVRQELCVNCGHGIEKKGDEFIQEVQAGRADCNHKYKLRENILQGEEFMKQFCD